MRSIARNLCPPIIWRMLPRPAQALSFTGHYKSFEDARRDSTGYESPDIVNTMAGLAAKKNYSSTELNEYTMQMLAAFSVIDGPISVLDVGGTNGAFYFLLSRHLPNKFKWTVLETKAMVAALKKDGPVEFITTATQRYDVILFSGSLQFMERPYEQLKKLTQGARFVIFNRLPLIDGNDRLTVQRVAMHYHGSYPAWFFSRVKFMHEIGGEIVMQWKTHADTILLDGKTVTFSGLMIRLSKENT